MIIKEPGKGGERGTIKSFFKKSRYCGPGRIKNIEKNRKQSNLDQQQEKGRQKGGTGLIGFTLREGGKGGRSKAKKEEGNRPMDISRKNKQVTSTEGEPWVAEKIKRRGETSNKEDKR